MKPLYFLFIVALACMISMMSLIGCSGELSPGKPAPKAGECTTEHKCAPSDGCVAPGPRPPVCGIQPQDMCQQDSECQSQGTHFICKPGAGTCGGKGCAAGCKADSECATYQVCNATHRCESKVCQQKSDCPANLMCNDQKQCVRTPCNTNAECDGYCVNNGCFDTPGKCEETLLVP